jgi:acyl-CoA thioesterase FadM
LWREAFGSYDAMVESGSDVVVGRAEADFHESPRFDDEIELHFAIEKLGNSSMVSRIEERRNGDLLVTGRMVHVFVNPETLEKKQIPDDVRARLKPFSTG